MNSLRQKLLRNNFGRKVTLMKSTRHLTRWKCYAKLCQSRTPEEREAFLWFSGKILECVYGKRAWEKRKYQTTMSEATEKGTGELIVTASDEAFAFLLNENYIEKWIQRYHKEFAGVEKQKRITGEYIGCYEYGGWSEDGVIRFNELCNIVKDDRNSRYAKEVEEEILASLRRQNYGEQSERNDDQGVDFSDSH